MHQLQRAQRSRHRQKHSFQDRALLLRPEFLDCCQPVAQRLSYFSEKQYRLFKLADYVRMLMVRCKCLHCLVIQFGPATTLVTSVACFLFQVISVAPSGSPHTQKLAAFNDHNCQSFYQLSLLSPS